jgi:hypothetical protein
MTDLVNNLPSGGIWVTTEFSTLQEQFAAGLITKCIAISSTVLGEARDLS